jgi:hypothetical protein
MWDEFAITLVACLITLLIVTLYVIFRLNEPLDMPAKRLSLTLSRGTTGMTGIPGGTGMSELTPDSDVLNRFRTGDLLAVSYNSIRGKLVRIFTGSMWTHIGMVYRTPESVCVIEMARYPHRQGIIKTPIDYWFDWNEDRVLAWKPYTGPDLPNEAIERIYNDIHPGDVDMFIGSWLRAMIKQPYHRQLGKKKFYCSELVSHFLQELGILERIYLPSGYPPKELLFGRPAFRPGYTYDEPIMLSLDSTHPQAQF